MTESLGYGAIHFLPHEAAPVPWSSVGITEEHGESTRKVVALLINLSEREDLVAVVEGHQKSLEGECETLWAPDPQDDKTLILAISFTKPVRASAFLEFDILKHGTIIDSLIQGGLLYLVPGNKDESLQEILSHERPRIGIEVYSEGIQWDSIWSSATAKQLEIPLEQAELLTMRWRLETSLRVKNPARDPSDSIAGTFYDDQIERMVIVTKDLLINQLIRTGPKTAESFDNMFESLLQELSSEYSRLFAEVAPIANKAARSDDKLEETCGNLLGNALFTSVAALDLIRLGYRLQPGALLRNALEAIAMASHLRLNPGDLGKALVGQLNSSDIGAAKQIFPPFGNIYGHLTKHFSHISPFHFETEPPKPYLSEDDPEVKGNLISVHAMLFLVGVYTEAIFFETVAQPRYWKRVASDKLKYDFSAEAQEYMDSIIEKFDIDLEVDS